MANGYAGFLTGKIPCPLRFISTDDGITNLNPSYTQWILMDQNLASALFATITPPILPYILNLHTCAEIWEYIEKCLAATNCAQVIQLKGEIHNLSMNNKTMNQNLFDIKIRLILLFLLDLQSAMKTLYSILLMACLPHTKASRLLSTLTCNPLVWMIFIIFFVVRKPFKLLNLQKMNNNQL